MMKKSININVTKERTLATILTAEEMSLFIDDVNPAISGVVLFKGVKGDCIEDTLQYNFSATKEHLAHLRPIALSSFDSDSIYYVQFGKNVEVEVERKDDDGCWLEKMPIEETDTLYADILLAVRQAYFNIERPLQAVDIPNPLGFSGIRDGSIGKLRVAKDKHIAYVILKDENSGDYVVNEFEDGSSKLKKKMSANDAAEFVNNLRKEKQYTFAITLRGESQVYAVHC